MCAYVFFLLPFPKKVDGEVNYELFMLYFNHSVTAKEFTKMYYALVQLLLSLPSPSFC